LQHALTALALWFQREDAIEETKTHLKDEFVWSLAKGEIEDWDKAATRAKSFNYNIHLPYVCILSIPENMETLFNRSASGGITYDHWLFDQICLLEEQMIEAGEMLKRKVMTTYHQEHFVIFLETDTDRVHESIGEYLNLVEKKVKNLLPGLVMSWGIGENHAGVKTFSQSYNDARIALYIGRRQKGPGHRSTYANTGIFRALFALSKNPEMEEIALSTIGSLIDYENQRGLDLIHTLTMYIRHKGNISQTSRALNLHRQSLVYRLRKIESLTGRSLENPDDLFLLDLSIKLWTTGMVLNQKEKKRPFFRATPFTFSGCEMKRPFFCGKLHPSLKGRTETSDHARRQAMLVFQNKLPNIFSTIPPPASGPFSSDWMYTEPSRAGL
jgi:PucR family transcriptional regulator, purine catabolism regulatory protein